MPPESTPRSRSPLPKRFQAPSLPPTPHRTTSQLSTISVGAHLSDEPVLVSSAQRHRQKSEPPPHTPSTPTKRPGSASGSSTPFLSPPAASTTLGSISGRSTPGLSRKGKERARDDIEDAIAGIQAVDVEGEMAVRTQSNVAAKGLRELVRRSTVGEEGKAVLTRQKSGQKTLETHTLDPPPTNAYTPRRYYVLTHAGKPVFSSHDDSTEENLTNLMGVAQALISIFAEDDDRIRCIVRGKHRIAFVLKAPLYLFCVSDWGEPEHVLRVHLEYIHLQILSVVSSTQLSRVFQRRSNFDLTRLLDGTENFLHSLVETCQSDFSYLTSTLQPLRMAPALRDNAAAALMPPSKFNDLLYVLLIAGGHIVTLLRPRKHSIHPSDLHLLLNTLNTSTTLKESESWLPMCFPKFNPAGFVHAYVSYVMEDVGLVFVSADREAFEDLRGWKAIVVEKLERDRTLSKIQACIPQHPYSVSVVGCTGLKHFIYKSRQHVQITAPAWEGAYVTDNNDRKRLITLYQQLNDTLHARSGQPAPLRLVYMRTEHEAVLGWVTKPFELYLAVSTRLGKSAVVAAANTVARWVASEEGRLFLKDAPVF